MLVSTGFVEDPWDWDIHFSECMLSPMFCIYCDVIHGLDDGPIRGRNSETV